MPDDLVVAQLANELRWAAEHAPGEYAVLNACRAWRFAADGALVSKIDGGQWALEHVDNTNRELITTALDRQLPLDRDVARHFVRQVLTRLTGAQREAPSGRRPAGGA